MKTRTKLFRIFGILLGALFVLACAVGFAACGGDDDTSGDHTHSYTSTVTTEPTCTEKGVMTYTCSCGDTYTEEIDALGHDYVMDEETSTVANCGDAGYTNYVCSRCGDKSKTGEVADPTGAHEVDASTWKVTQEATCGEDGSRTGKCDICGKEVTETIPATGEHSVKTWDTNTATCGRAGVRTGTCDVCGEEVTENVSATEAHNFGDLTATSTEGLYTQTCSECGYVQYVEKSVEATDENEQTVEVLRAEAEYAAIDADESMMYYWLKESGSVFQGNYISDLGFLFGIQQDSTASNGYSVGYLAHGNPTLTFTIHSDTAVTGAKITVHGASCDIDDSEISSVYGLMVAGVSEYKAEDHPNVLSKVTTSTSIFGTTTTTVTPISLSGSYKGSSSVFVGDEGALAYNTWGDLAGTVDLAAGDNTLVLTHDGSGVNFDYIEIETAEGEELSFVETDNSNLVTYDPDWVAYDVVSLEAGNAGLFNAADSSTFMETVDFVQTGEEKVENFTKGDKMLFQVLASDDIAEANITVNVASGGTLAATDITMTSTSLVTSVTEVEDDENPDEPTTVTTKENVTTDLTVNLSRGTIQATTDLTEGVNYIELTCASDDALEVDGISIDWDYADADADYGAEDSPAKTAGRGTYVVSNIEEVPVGGMMYDVANATALDETDGGGYALKVEAEDSAVLNAPGKTESYILGIQNSGMVDTECLDEVTTSLKFFKEGDQVIFAVYAAEAMSDVTITINAATGSYSTSVVGSDIGQIISVNGTAYSVAGTLEANKTYYNWGELTVEGSVSLVAGVNYIVLTCGSSDINVDGITLTWGVIVAE